MLPPLQSDRAIDSIVREEWGRLLALLTGSVGDLQLAEDVLQDAVEVALVDWQKNGVPDSPAAWLIQTARRRAIDRFRREARFRRLAPEVAYLQDLDTPDDVSLPGSIPDKRLELIFTCCHPALEHKSRVALTLRTLGGLTTGEIARSFLDKPKTMAQRLTRAKQKIALAGIAYEVPAPEQLSERLEAVLAVIYFIFNEGYAASSGHATTRTELSNEAIRLARILHSLLPDEVEVSGLLSLMLLHDARRRARQHSDGSSIALEDQDRRRWDKAAIAEGTNLLKSTLRRQRVGSYQLQAAISAIHNEASTWAMTDWRQIAALYELLHAMQPSPVIRINHAVAVSYADSPEAALALLDTLADDDDLRSYQPYHAARADLYARLDLYDDAKRCYRRAIALASTTADRAFLDIRLARLKD